MANIKNHLNNIKNALFGQEVRGSIHDGIDAINKEVESTTGRQVDLEKTFDQLVINAGNSNAEIVDARVKSDGTSYSKLGDRLNEVDSQLEQNMNKINEQFNTIANNHFTVSVKDFGAKGDGVTEDTLSIVKSIQYLQTKGGGTLYFPKGTYLIGGIRIGDFEGIANIGETASIDCVNNIKLLGEDKFTTIIKQIDNRNNDIIVFRYCENLSFANLTFDGNKDNQSSMENAYWTEGACNILIRDSKNITVQDCIFKNSMWFGLNVSSDSQNVKIQNNIFYNCSTGVDVCGQYIDIENNIVENCSDVGIFLEGNIKDINYDTFSWINAFVSVTNNSVINSLRGISVKNGAYSIKIKNNRVKNSTKSAGIIIDGSNLTTSKIKDVEVIGNSILLCETVPSIILNNIEGGIVSNNNCEKNMRGVYVYKCNNININNNIIKENKEYGINLYRYCIGCIIDNNVIINNNKSNLTDTTATGIHIDGSTNSEITINKNTIGNTDTENSQLYGIVLNSNPLNIYITENILKGNKLNSFLDKSGGSSYKWFNNITSDNTNPTPTILTELKKYSMNGFVRMTHTNAPLTGSYKKGDIVYNENPVPGDYVGWVCTQSGSPGTWKGFGIIES